LHSVDTPAAFGPAKFQSFVRVSSRILVVEDEKAVARAVSRMLEQSGYTVPAIASSGAEAIKKAREIRPDLVLMDISLDGSMDGADAAIHIHRQLGLPIIYLTGQADEATLERAKEAQPFGYLLKPVGAQELHSAITMALHSARIKRDEQQQPVARTTAQHGSAAAEGVAVLPENRVVDIDSPAAAAEDLWQTTVNYFELWNAYDQVVRTADSAPQGGALEEAARTLVVLAENELRHSTEVFREGIVRAGGLADEVPKTARAHYFRDLATRDDLTRKFQQREVPQVAVEQACSQVGFAQSRLRDAAIKLRDSAHLASWMGA
jgi:CheY-like chemotaxis protein